MSETITGEVRQILEPGDEQKFVVPEPLSGELQRGRYVAVVRTDTPPAYARVLERLPTVVSALLGLPLAVADTIHPSGLPDPSEWDRRVVVETPDFTEGDTVTLTATQEILVTETTTFAEVVRS